jgi:hypothetical protein
LSNVVYKVQWECKRSDSSNNSVDETGICTLTQADPNNFIQYDNLTKAEVVNWVKSTLGTPLVNIIEARLVNRLNDKLSTVILDPPFTN